ncbi:hypothetical protein LXA43DRAFT_1091974 [Ganoderma leucocontextum]|nr:hypothetical protein LXA43DRAFT_1091974 [Ganoderma leucocontextum]
MCAPPLAVHPNADAVLDQLSAELPANRSAIEIDMVPWMAWGPLEYVGQGILRISFVTLGAAKISEYAEYANVIRSGKVDCVPPVACKFSRYLQNKAVD